MNEDLLKELFDYADGCLYWKKKRRPRIKAGDEAGWTDEGGYKRVIINGKTYFVHKLVWEYHGLHIPDGMQIDHINHNQWDCRIENLRVVSFASNMKNKSTYKTSKTGCSGVTKRTNGKYQVKIGVKGKQVYIGTFAELDEAIKAKRSAEIEYGFHNSHNK